MMPSQKSVTSSSRWATPVRSVRRLPTSVAGHSSSSIRSWPRRCPVGSRERLRRRRRPPPGRVDGHRRQQQNSNNTDLKDSFLQEENFSRIRFSKDSISKDSEFPRTRFQRTRKDSIFQDSSSRIQTPRNRFQRVRVFQGLVGRPPPDSLAPRPGPRQGPLPDAADCVRRPDRRRPSHLIGGSRHVGLFGLLEKLGPLRLGRRACRLAQDL
jgi:hypothetical protein